MFSALPPAFVQSLPAPPVHAGALAWPDLEALQREGNDLLLLPVGATEQHGPHLPCDTDTRIAAAVCEVASALTGAPVLPPLTYGVSLGHTEKWPGTFSLFHESFIASAREIVRWAAATGWKRLIFVNGHCGNDASLRVAVDRLRFDFAGTFFTAVRNTFALTPELAAEFSADAADWHANRAETELIAFLAPETVRFERLAVADDPDRTAGCLFPHLVAHTSRNGVTGEPSSADFSRGEALLRRLGEALADTVRAARTEQTPLTWHRTGSLPSPTPLHP